MDDISGNNRPDWRFAGVSVWVTGADTPVGAAASDMFEREGAKVLRSGVDGIPNPRTSAEAFAQTAGLDKIDILVTAVRSISVKPLLESDAADFDNAVADNLIGVFAAMQAAFLKMVDTAKPEPHSNGVMLVVSSIHGEKPNGSAPLYSVACGGLNMLVREAAQEYGRLGVRVNLLAVGPLEGDPALFPSGITAVYDDAEYKIPRQRLGTPEEAARAALMLCSKDASFMNGASVPCDGGYQGFYMNADVERRLEAALAIGKEAGYGR
ncbi:MAG: SDR family oxidoreductase [Oscillospiraceae bacterium]|jgi:NAD(P)-dependent dehydrogenase (short-subunit alcohol dehydrogenase family)|nr:SDR family oxidoreductase [Oscillospiraceae bacterium]